MKTYKLFLYLITVVIMSFTGCIDKTDLTAPAPQNPVSGTADLTRYVAIGNSITAGMQSLALYEGAQIYSYGNLIARQVNTNFAMPLISEPGLGGKLQLRTIDPLLIIPAPSTGQPRNLTYPAPYNNLGIPGAFVYDVLNARDSLSCFSSFFAGKPNPLFNLVLRQSATQFEQARLLQPTFITVWIGSNEVLGFATSGGYTVPSLFPAPNFAMLYHQMADSISSLGAKVVAANIPDIATIPFFTTVGPQVAFKVPWRKPGLPGLFYQKHGETVNPSSITDSISLRNFTVILTLPASTYAAYLGIPTGKWYTDNHYPGLPDGIDTTQLFGFHPQNPFPDALVLDELEIQGCYDAVAAYNNTIRTEADARGWGLVDINQIFRNIRLADAAGGITFGGVKFNTGFITGGLFSLDGVHPSNQGQAIIANEFLKVINSRYNSTFPLIDIGTIPGSISFGKKAFYGIPYFENVNWRNFFF